jgi:sugar phosphate isomerase/epimerase
VTTGEIFLIVALKGAVVVVLAKLGWWPDWEARAKRREEDKKVLRAYHEWREHAGPEAAAKVGVALEALPKRSRNRWSIKKRPRQ